MSTGVLAIIATAVGALVGIFGQQVYLWRENRRRFDEARQVAYTNLVAEAFMTHNEFASVWSPFTLMYGRRKYIDLQNDVTRAVAAVRVVATEPVRAAAVELMEAVSGIVGFATDVLSKHARFGMAAWYL